MAESKIPIDRAKIVSGPYQESASTTVSANANVSINVDITKSGYTPIAPNFLMTNAGADVIVIGWAFNDTTLTIATRNMTSGSKTFKVAYRMLYTPT